MPREFTIEFDVLAGHHPNTGATLGEEILNPYGWRSIGASKGGRFSNQTGGVIAALYLKANNAGDALKIAPESAGSLFATVWLKNDGKEALFMDANIPVSSDLRSDIGAFWMRVPRNDDGDIQNCDDCHAQSPNSGCEQNCPFTGQVFRKNPPDPTAGGWKKIKGAFDRLGPRWRSLMAACPSAFRDIQCYGESADGRRTMFISNGDLLLYDDQTKTVSLLRNRHTALSLVNHVSGQDEDFVLSRNGSLVQRLKIHSDRAGFHEVGRLPAD